MIRIKQKEDCVGCYACYSVCPTQCIKMVPDEEGFRYPLVDSNKCINCGLCESVCPSFNNRQEQAYNKRIALAAISLDNKSRFASSSGGIFSLIATEIIKCGGVVIGAVFDNDFRSVHHFCAEKLSELELIRGAKYIPSIINDAFAATKDYLDNGRSVLFTGTPCQIAALKLYLNGDAEKLYTQDIICHGVASPFVWNRYLDLRENEVSSEANMVSFRHKKYGWRAYSTMISYSNGEKYFRSHQEDSFMRAFLFNYSLRPSCYNCRYKNKSHQADITLGDLWGINNIAPEIDDDNGTSLVIANTIKGHALIKRIDGNSRNKMIDFSEVTKYKTDLSQSLQVPNCREAFFRDLLEENIDIVSDRYAPIRIKDRIKISLKKCSIIRYGLRIKKLVSMK